MSKYLLKDLLVINNGKDYKKNKAGNIPIYGSGGIMNYSGEYLYEGESILLPRKGTLDNIQYVNGKFWTIDTTYWTVINEEIVYPKFLYIYLSLLNICKRNTGSTLPSMTYDTYYSIEVDIPSLDEQIRIADNIFYINKKIENNNKIIECLHNINIDTFNFWFKSFNFPYDGSPYFLSGNQMEHNELLNCDIPVNFTVCKFRDIITKISTGLNPRNHFKLNTGNIKYVTVKNILDNGEIDFSRCDTMNEEARAKVHKRSDIKINDILYASIAPLGRAHIIKSETNDWDINESVFSIRCKNSNYSNFLYYLIQSEDFVYKATHSSTGSIFSGIRITALNDIDVLIPDEKVIIEFNKVIENNIRLIDSLFTENETLKKYKDFVSSGLVTKKIIIKEVE